MDIVIRKGSAGNLDDVLKFLQKIQDGMRNKDWFYLDPPEMIRLYMSSGIMDLWLALDDNRIVGMFYTLIPGLEDCNYGYDLDLCEEELLRVIHMDTVAVHPDYRGLGLHRRLMALAEEELRSGGWRILLCTVHPDNQYSLNNVLHRGYTIEKQVGKYHSVRYILRKDIL